MDGTRSLLRGAVPVSVAALACAAAGLVVAAPASGGPDAPAQDQRGAFSAPEHASLGFTGDTPATPRALAAGGGAQTYLLELGTRSTQQAFERNRPQGLAAASSAARAQLERVKASQSRVTRSLPPNTKVLYATHTALNSIAVRTGAASSARLERIAGVTAVYPVASKEPSNSYAVPLVGADSVWQSLGDTGQGTTIAIVDSGLDYTHANFGGPGTPADYQTARAAEADPADPLLFPSSKIIGGYDFAGDAYDAEMSPTPHPDPNPLDCNGHGSHVGGTAAGLGVGSDGATYSGSYDESTPFDTLGIGPGMAPDAQLYAYRVFGCGGSTAVVGAALDRAADPNQDGDPSDHVDVVNMSLGSGFGSPLDGDSVLSDALAEVGVNVVVASGNAGDLYDVGGSPSSAVRAIAVANSTDAATRVDSVSVSAPESVAGTYGAQRSVSYDWSGSPDLVGTVAQVTGAGNLDGCFPLGAADAAAVVDKIAWVEWTSDDTRRRCGSVVRARNLADAGAIGFVFADDGASLSSGITGSAAIPGVIVVKSAGDTIRPVLGAGVQISGTTAKSYTQVTPVEDDLLNAGSSRGVHNGAAAKPDVAAIGTTVFSTANGTGSQGVSFTGTSMATPMVAGLASLVVSRHPDWTPEEVKADIMNTAGQDVFTGPDHTGRVWAPNRVGSGRIDALAALDNEVVAYLAGDTGAVSASFGPVEVTEPTTLTRTIAVANKGDGPASYDVSYEALTQVPGAAYSVAPDAVTIEPHSTRTVELTLSLDPSLLTKTIDPTVARTQSSWARQYLADASGRVRFASPDRPDLRVPVYSAPRPASQMTQAASLTLPPGAVQTADLELTGADVYQGSGLELIASYVAGFELQAVSERAPDCAAAAGVGCVHNADERAADLKYVGTSSAFFGADPIADGWGYFAISTHAPWSTGASRVEFDVEIDTDHDGAPDFVVVNTRFTGTDVQVSALFSASGNFLDVGFLNDVPGDYDTALFDSDTMLLSFPIAALGIDEATSRVSYAVRSYSRSLLGPVDVVGEDAGGEIDGSLSVDLLHPGVHLGATDAVLLEDYASTVPLTRDRDAYAADHGLGALIVHLHNKVGAKAQVVALVNQTTTPVPTGRPVVSGRARSGDTLTTTDGRWESADNAPTSYSYEWLRCSGGCDPIPGADQDSYQPTDEDVGVRLRSRVTGMNTAGEARTQSLTTSLVVPAAPVLVHRPVIDGVPRVGRTLTTTDGDWDNSPTEFAYQWRSCDGGSCRDILGATDPTYVVAAAVAGSRLRVRVKARNSGGGARANTAATSVIRP